jgi:N-acyl-D-amino-acid deacylase
MRGSFIAKAGHMGAGAARFAAAILLIASASQAAADPATLIEGATIVDGTGKAGFPASVRVSAGRIAEVGTLARRPDDVVVSGQGLVLAPGFIDTHSHHDRGLAEQRDATAATSQGITTIVVGQDGSSAPSLERFFGEFDRNPAAVNVASYAGHGTLRSKAMGADFRRAATGPELAAMKALLAAEMNAGALGLSTGLEYDPGIYSAKEEVLELAKAAAADGGRYISHIRSEDRTFWEAVDEIIDIGRRTGMPVQLSHAKLAMVDWWGHAPKLIARLENARREGVRITADVYPYEYWQSTLTVLFPDRDFTDRKAAEFALKSLAPPEGLRLSRYLPNPSLEGKTVAEIAAQRGSDPAQTLMDLIAAAPEAGVSESVIATSMTMKDIAALTAWRHSNISSDGLLGGGHPRGAGAFTRALRLFVREQRLLTIEQAVHKMTGLSAEHMGIADRGVISPGAPADLVLFDPKVVADRATIEHPDLLSIGIARVWVNGELVFADGRSTGKHPGVAIRRRSTAAAPQRDPGH